jgi:DNA polymerase III subunit epsilon
LTVSEVEFAAIDFESAGAARGATDVPVQIGIARMAGGRIVAESRFTSYLAADRPVTWSARDVHGIRDEDLVGAPRLLDLWPKLKAEFSGRWLVAHGAGTEKRFLRVFPLHGFGPWVDTLTLTRAVYPDLASHALGGIVEALGLVGEMDGHMPGFRWHDALSDAVASLVVLRHIIEVANLSDKPAEVLRSLKS